MTLLRPRWLRRRRSHEPVYLLALAVTVPVLTLLLLAWQGRNTRFPEPPVGVAHPAALGSPHEDPGLSPWEWWQLARDAPLAFAASLDFCRDQDTDAPLPNCRNVLVTGRACRLFETVSAGGGRAR